MTMKWLQTVLMVTGSLHRHGSLHSNWSLHRYVFAEKAVNYFSSVIWTDLLSQWKFTLILIAFILKLDATNHNGGFICNAEFKNAIQHSIWLDLHVRLFFYIFSNHKVHWTKTICKNNKILNFLLHFQIWHYFWITLYNMKQWLKYLPCVFKLNTPLFEVSAKNSQTKHFQTHV